MTKLAMDGGKVLAFWSISTTLMQEEHSFQHLSVQYEFGYRNENVLRLKVGYLKKKHVSSIVSKFNF